MSREQLLRVAERLASLESMSWTAIQQGTGSHPVAKSKLAKMAVDRLVEIRQEDIDELYSIRVTGRMRVWGIKDLAALRLLWFDPNHEVCPSLPD